jgi:hypothetical protein
MRSSLSIALVAFSGLVILACGGSGSDGPPKGGGGTGGTGGVSMSCETLDPMPEGCDDLCPSGSDSECTLGTHCLNGTCEAQCTATQGCAEGASCNVRGRCVPDVGTGGTGGTGNTNGCQSVTITPTRSIPNVMFLVDQSGSMTSGFGGGENRWQAAHSAITNIVSNPVDNPLDEAVRFGLTTYTSDNGNDNLPCPRLPTQVGFALGNSMGPGTIGDNGEYPYQYPNNAGADTPTGDSINALVGLIQEDPPPNDGPTIIVLATDGLPDSCECPNGFPPDPQDAYCEPGATDPKVEAFNAAAAAHAEGIDVFALWVGDLDDNPNDPTRSHMQDVANAGIGGTGTVYVGDDPPSLSSAFQSIISASISCDVMMDEQFDDVTKACNEGAVTLNNSPLSCPAGDWRVKPGVNNVIELLGDACIEFKTGSSTFSATFPCGAIIVE